ncbi:hypothetical protein [Ornithinimicrobium sediminis]|uniref:hypothetical protein n=1 Tax=Ornithinimicrobium sediminis TaxID=2904603 RepID=UPI001E438D21|nr:hypothetical protein [Ornithinimicrobium sediminis]MCE0485881.1 hypothetical protein [Ornithinimicrobium sediminis]
MDGWKTAERRVRGKVLLDHAVADARERGFTVREQLPGHAILTRAGTQLTTKGEKLPLELTVSQAEDGVLLRLRYDTFALADTGDLEGLVEEIATDIGRSVDARNGG